VGRVKEEWMDFQESEAMYDWIEENYGDDAGEEGSDSWNEAVQAFEDYCEKEQQLEEERFWQDEYDYYLTLTLKDADLILSKDLTELKAMLIDTRNDVSNQTFCKMVYAHAVTILEVYLEDVVKALIMSNEEYLGNTIKNVPSIRDTKLKLSDISLGNGGIKKFVLAKLSDNLFHNIPKALEILSGVIGKRLDVAMDDICNVTSNRHDIVHRNGKNKEGEMLVIDATVTLSAVNAVETFTNHLRLKLSEI
jgi:hypothetical protein